MSSIEYIQSENIIPPAGHYSHATVYDKLVFVSGQLPVQTDGSHDANLSFENQARLALTALQHVLCAAGSDTKMVLRVSAYIVGVENWGIFNRVYADVFGETRPARTVVPVPELHHGYLIELDAVAVRGTD